MTQKVIQKGDVSVFETNIRFIGGLLSIYALTGDKVHSSQHQSHLLCLCRLAVFAFQLFRVKAEEVARKLLPAFKTPHGIPKSLININTLAEFYLVQYGNFSTSLVHFRLQTRNYPWAASGASILSEFGTLQLEMDYLSHVSGDPVFADLVKKINEHIKSIRLDSNLYSNYLNPNTGKWGSGEEPFVF